MRMRLLAALAVGLLPLGAGPRVAADPKDDAVQKELKALSGDWKATGVLANGKVEPRDEGRGDFRIVIEGNRYTFKLRGQVLETGSLTVDPTKTLKVIDLVPAGGPNAGKTLLGVYELKDNELKLSWADPGQARPPDLASKAGGFQFKRVKQ
jgi:uncharacterized protein (TIGR03067 family)